MLVRRTFWRRRTVTLACLKIEDLRKHADRRVRQTVACARIRIPCFRQLAFHNLRTNALSFHLAENQGFFTNLNLIDFAGAGFVIPVTVDSAVARKTVFAELFLVFEALASFFVDSFGAETFRVCPAGTGACLLVQNLSFRTVNIWTASEVSC